MIVETTQDAIRFQDAEDVIAGWRELPFFIMGYVRVPPPDSSTPYYAVGLFECKEGKAVKDQREVLSFARSEQTGGVAIIAAERRRQVIEEGFKPKHDATHQDESMAMVAACYSSPDEIYIHKRDEITGTHVFHDPWPKSWSKTWDKRGKHDRRKQLAIAGALCAAEIDRLDAQEVERDLDAKYLDLPIPKIGNNLSIKYSAACFGQCEMECAADVIIRVAYQKQSWRVPFIELDFLPPNIPEPDIYIHEGFKELVIHEWLVRGPRKDREEYFVTGAFVKRLQEKHPDDLKEKRHGK